MGDKSSPISDGLVKRHVSLCLGMCANKQIKHVHAGELTVAAVLEGPAEPACACWSAFCIVKRVTRLKMSAMVVVPVGEFFAKL